MKQSIPALIVVACLCARSSNCALAAPEDDGPYSCTRHAETIPARDGGAITALVYTSDAPGERPLIIFRHGYVRTSESLAACGRHWASRGCTVILNDARSGIRPDYSGRDSGDMIDCAGWAVRNNDEPGHYLHGAVNKNAVIIGGFSAGGYAALVATHRNCALGDGEFTCAAMVLYDPYPVDTEHAAALARKIHVPSIMLHAEDGICNDRGKGKVIFRNTAGPTYAIHVKNAGHCDFEPQPFLGCELVCMCSWDSGRNAAVRRYATAMIEACAGDNAGEAYPYINGPIAQADTRITIYPETRGLDLPPLPVPPQTRQRALRRAAGP